MKERNGYAGKEGICRKGRDMKERKGYAGKEGT